MNLKKKLVAFGMVCVLALGMAISAFADYDGSTTWTNPGPITATQGVGAYTNLNLEGSSSYAYAYRDVTLYSRTNSDDQKWRIKTLSSSSDAVYVFTVRRDTSGRSDYALNYIQSAPHNCNILSISQNNPYDCQVKIKGSPISFYVELANRFGVRLNYERAGVGRNVYWGTAFDYWRNA